MAFDSPGAAAQGDVHELGLDALDGRQRFHVGADLEQGRGLDVASELRVHHLVAPAAQGAGPFHAHQEVGQPEPPAVEERRLVDDVVAPPDRLFRGRRRGSQPFESRGGRRVVIAGVHSRHAPPVAFERRQIAGLVLEASPRNQIDLRIEPDRPLHQPGHRRQLQADEMLAGQEADEIRRGKDGVATDELHRRSR